MGGTRVARARVSPSLSLSLPRSLAVFVCMYLVSLQLVVFVCVSGGGGEGGVDAAPPLFVVVVFSSHRTSYVSWVVPAIMVIGNAIIAALHVVVGVC